MAQVQLEYEHYESYIPITIDHPFEDILMMVYYCDAFLILVRIQGSVL